jgi:predicted metal-dependent peptidase
VQGNRANKGSSSHNFNRDGARGKKDEIVPWGWEKEAKDERKKKAAANVAKEAAAKAAREYDPATVVQEKVVKKQPEDFKGKGKNAFTPQAKAAAMPPAK